MGRASMLLYFKGITADFHDINLIIANEDADRARNILLKMSRLESPNPNAKYKTKLFMEFVIKGMDVGAMVKFAIINENEVTGCSLKKEQIAENIPVDGEKIPAQSVCLWQEYYRLMGRAEKVEMIEKTVCF